MDVQTLPQPHACLSARFSTIAADAEQVRHLHRVLGPYCHESRNVLNVLKMSLYLSRRGAEAGSPDVLDGVAISYERLERMIDRLHQLCRPLPFCPVRLPIHLLFQERQAGWEAVLGQAGRRLEFVRPDSPVLGSFDPGRLGEALDDLIAWRASIGPSDQPVVIQWGEAEGIIRVECHDAAVGRPGSRVGDVLAVPLVARAAALHGGFVETDQGEGFRLRLIWPSDGFHAP